MNDPTTANVWLRRLANALMSDVAVLLAAVGFVCTVAYVSGLCLVDWGRANGTEEAFDLERAADGAVFWGALYGGPTVVVLLCTRSHRWVRLLCFAVLLFIANAEAGHYLRTGGHDQGDQKGCDIGGVAFMFGLLANLVAIGVALRFLVVLSWRKVQAMRDGRRD